MKRELVYSQDPCLRRPFQPRTAFRVKLLEPSLVYLLHKLTVQPRDCRHSRDSEAVGEEVLGIGLRLSCHTVPHGFEWTHLRLRVSAVPAAVSVGGEDDLTHCLAEWQMMQARLIAVTHMHHRAANRADPLSCLLLKIAPDDVLAFSALCRDYLCLSVGKPFQRGRYHDIVHLRASPLVMVIWSIHTLLVKLFSFNQPLCLLMAIYPMP